VEEKFVPDCYRKSIIVLGCGNVLFGDDGFGPAVIEFLEKNYRIPEDVCVMDVGTGAREILFNIVLSEKRPRKVIIVDSVDIRSHHRTGEILELSIDAVPENKIDDFSMHQIPTSNLLRELSELCNVEVRIIAAQVEYIPETVSPGLSKSLTDSIPEACRLIMGYINREQAR